MYIGVLFVCWGSIQIPLAMLCCLLLKQTLFSHEHRIHCVVNLSCKLKHKHSFHTATLMVCHMTDSWGGYFSQNECMYLIYVPARLKTNRHCLHIICFLPQPAECSPSWKCICYPKIFISGPEVTAINGLMFDHMNKKRQTCNPICIHTCPKLATTPTP